MQRANHPTIFKGWNTCLDCGYEGLHEYTRIEGESYENIELGVMMVLRCPACESTDNAFVTVEYYAEMMALRENQDDSDA